VSSSLKLSNVVYKGVKFCASSAKISFSPIISSLTSSQGIFKLFNPNKIDCFSSNPYFSIILILALPIAKSLDICYYTLCFSTKLFSKYNLYE